VTMLGSGSHEQVRRAIVSHFAPRGGIGAVFGLGGRARAARREREMRAHLPGCAECRAFYERWLLAASVDPAVPSDQDRLARGLGLAVAPAPRNVARPLGLFVGLAAAAAILVLVLRPGPGPDEGGGPGQFVARGGGMVGAPIPELAVYRIARVGEAGAAPEPVTDEIRATDEVAFAYRNTAGKRRLLVFAVDEHGHVFWYHPGWSDPNESPRAVAISTIPGLHELHAAISQRYDGQRLSFHALFKDLDLTVRQVEAALAAASRAGEEVKEWPFPNTIDVVHSVRVER